MSTTQLSSLSSDMPMFPPLTLILATTPSFGLGFRGTLPWPPLKTEMAFFARVTKKAPPLLISTKKLPPPVARKTINAVLMGRKTWSSIPAARRPLKGRVNVVITRSPAALATELGQQQQGGREVLVAGSIEEGLKKLVTKYPPSNLNIASAPEKPEDLALGRVFVIGGAEIYNRALQMENCDRVLWTRLECDWECDVFFPGHVILGGESGSGSEWVQRSNEYSDIWCGENGVGGKTEEDDVGWKVELWEREK
ncbi:dihydrofolate reductase [Peltigera leucophlebia]|nr:dihydrofolate reductase [Peltigera leucophlebia]